MARNVTRTITTSFSALICVSTAALSCPFWALAAAEKIEDHRGAKATLIVANVSVAGAKSPLGLFDGSGFESQASAEFVKVSLVFDPPVQASKVALESCAGEFRDGVEFSLSPGARRVYAEGGFDSVTSSLLQSGSAESSTEVRSLAINFRHNQTVCIKSLRFKGPGDVVLDVKLGAELVAADTDESSKEKLVAAKSTVELAHRLHASFLQAGLPSVLEQELVLRNEKDRWVFRFRSDGTYFIFGTNDEGKGASRFSIIGTYEAEPGAKNKITLHLKGRRFISAEPWDGAICGSPCGGAALANTKLISETIVVEKISTGYMIRNRESKAKRSIPFGDLSAHASTL